MCGLKWVRLIHFQSDSVAIYKLKGLLHEFGVIKSENWESESIKRQTAPNNRGCYVSSTFSYEVVEYKTPLLSLNASTVGGVLRYVSETCVQDRKLLFRPFKLSKSHLDGRASRPVGRVELAPRKNVFPVAYTVLWVRMPVYMCSGVRLKERRGAALSDFLHLLSLQNTHTS